MPKSTLDNPDPLAAVAHSLDTIAAAKAELTDQVAAIRRQLADLEQQRELVQHSPIPPAEYGAQLDHFVSTRARLAREAIGNSFAHGDLALLRYCSRPEQAGHSELPVNQLPSWFDLICAGAPQLAVQVLTGFAAGLNLHAGPPSADRARLIAELDTQIAALQADEEALIDRAQALGLSIEHREAVRNRRYGAQRAEKEEADRQAYWCRREGVLSAMIRQQYESGALSAIAALEAERDRQSQEGRGELLNDVYWRLVRFGQRPNA